LLVGGGLQKGIGNRFLVVVFRLFTLAFYFDEPSYLTARLLM
jgi:hypothetical protein